MRQGKFSPGDNIVSVSVMALPHQTAWIPLEWKTEMVARRQDLS